MKEDKSIFLKVDSVEPVYNVSPFSYSGESYFKGIKVWIGGDGHFFDCDRFTVYDPDTVREDAYQQAFSLFKELYDMPPCDRQEAFGKKTMLDLVSKNTYEDIAKKLAAWKKEKDEIHVRDEVVNINNGCKMVITLPPKMSSNSVEYMSGIGRDGKVYKDVVAGAYKKTGVHVDDLDAYLEV